MIKNPERRGRRWNMSCFDLQRCYIYVEYTRNQKLRCIMIRSHESFQETYLKVLRQFRTFLSFYPLGVAMSLNNYYTYDLCCGE